MKRFIMLALGAIALGVAGCDKTPVTQADPTLDITYNGTVGNPVVIGDISSDGAKMKISIISNRDWGMTSLPEEVQWVHVSKMNGTKDEPAEVELTIDENTGEARSVKLEFTTTDRAVSRFVNLSQLAGGGDEPQPITISSARMEYVWDRYRNQTGSHWLTFQYDNEDGTRSEINLECVSDFAQDLLQAVPAVGTYVFADTHAKFTFTEFSEFLPDVSDYKTHVNIVGGSMTLAREGSACNVVIDVQLADEQVIKAQYKGAIYPIFFPEVSANATVDKWTEVSFEKFLASDNMWKICLKDDSGVALNLVLNTEKDLSELPTGKFPMAAASRAGVAGTAEPASMHSFDNYEWGCWFWGKYEAQAHVKKDYPDVQYAVPGKGEVNISREGDVYTIAFSFVGPDGKSVSGNCTKKVVVEEKLFDVTFTSATYDYYAKTNYFDLKFFHGESERNYLSIQCYVTPIGENEPKIIPEGTYEFDGNKPFTFDSYCFIMTDGGNTQIYVDKGTCTVTHVGDDYKIDFNLHLEKDGRTIKTTYQGPIKQG